MGTYQQPTTNQYSLIPVEIIPAVVPSSNKSNQQNKKYRKGMIVIGIMGSGKSSFVRMLARPEQKPKIKIQASNKAVTTECALYKVDPALKLYPQDPHNLYIIDTVGLSTIKGVFLAINQLNDFIIQNQLQIIGLLYVLDLYNPNNKSQNGQKNIFTFLDHVKLRNSFKKKKMACVLTHFDEYHKKKQNNQVQFSKYKQIFIAQNMVQIWNNKILWMNQPKQDPAQYFKIVRDPHHIANPIFMNQWRTLKDNLRQHSFLPFEQYLKDFQTYQKAIQIQMATVLQLNRGITLTTVHQQFNIKKVLSSTIPQKPQTTHKTCILKFQNQESLQKQIKQFQHNQIIKCTQIKNNRIYVNSIWIDHVSAQIHHNNATVQRLIFRDNLNRKEAPLSEGKLIVKYKFKTPTIQTYEQYSKIIAKRVYGSL